MPMTVLSFPTCRRAWFLGTAVYAMEDTPFYRRQGIERATCYPSLRVTQCLVRKKIRQPGARTNFLFLARSFASSGRHSEDAKRNSRKGAPGVIAGATDPAYDV